MSKSKKYEAKSPFTMADPSSRRTGRTVPLLTRAFLQEQAQASTREREVLQRKDTRSRSRARHQRQGMTWKRRDDAVKRVKRREKMKQEFIKGTLEKSFPESTFLEKAAAPTMDKTYAKLCRGFVDFAAKFQKDVSKAEILDETLVDYCCQKALEGHAGDFGDKLRAALLAKHPAYVREGKISTPRFDRARKGWKKLAPSFARDAAAEEMCFAVCGYMLSMGWRDSALINATQFSTYGRPSSILRLSTDDFISADASDKNPTLLMDPREGLVPNKTGKFDNTVILDDTRLPELGALLEEHVSRREAAEKRSPDKTIPLWGIDAQTVHEQFIQATGALRIDKHYRSQYQNRHGGPSRDRELKLRSLEEVQRRGHWALSTSVRNYEKAGRLALMRRNVGKSVCDYGENVRRNFAHFVRSGSCPCPLASQSTTASYSVRQSPTRMVKQRKQTQCGTVLPQSK